MAQQRRGGRKRRKVDYIAANHIEYIDYKDTELLKRGGREPLSRHGLGMFHVKHLFFCRTTLSRLFHVKHNKVRRMKCFVIK